MSLYNSQIVYQSLTILCRILKSHAGIYYYQMAKGIGVDASVLSKWLKGSAVISENSRNKMIVYFSKEEFSAYQSTLAEAVVETYHIRKGGQIEWTLYHMEYRDMIRYIFMELSREDIEYERVGNETYRKSVTLTIARKLHVIHYELKTIEQKSYQLSGIHIHMEFVEIIKMNHSLANILLVYGDQEEIKKMDMQWQHQFISDNEIITKKVQYLVFVYIPNGMYISGTGQESEQVCDVTVRKILAIIR